MKKLFGALLALVSSVALATTTVPVQLLNPAGSSAGQTIVSTGASSAPGWATVPLSGLSSIAANTVLANATSGSAVPTAFSMPSCSTSTSILQYTTSTGFTCNTSAWTAGNAASFSTLTATGQTSLGGAPGAEALRAVTTASAVNWLQVNGAITGGGPSLFAQGSDTNISLGISSKGGGSVFLTTGGGNQVIVTNTASTSRTLTLTGSNGGNPTIGTSAGNVAFSSAIAPSTTLGIVGTTLADNANAGSDGEFITATGTGVALTTSTTANITSISLTAGDWDVSGDVEFDAAATTTSTFYVDGITTTSATLPSAPDRGALAANFPTNATVVLIAPTQRINVSTTTTVYLTGFATFATSTMAATGRIRARRVR